MGETLTLTLERFAAQGRAVARHEGKAVLVERGIAGETVAAEVVRSEARFAIARVADVLSPSPDRIPPPCPHFDRCGGCQWQHLKYPAQVVLKRQVAQEQLERIGHLEVPGDWDIVPAPQPLEYRDKLEWVPVAEDGRWVAGLHGPADGAPVPIERCLLAPPELSDLAQRALAALAAAGSRGKPGTPPGGVVRITVQSGATAEGAPALALTLHVRHAGQVNSIAAQASHLLNLLREALPQLSTVAVAAGDDPERPGGLRVAAGDGVLHKTVGGVRYPVPIDAFFQVHPAQAELLVAHVVAQVAALLPVDAAAPPRLFDLYCGAGLFAVPLLARGYAVMGAEVSRTAVRAAQRAAGAAGLDSGGFVSLDLERSQALRTLIRAHGHPQGVILDPPRRGLPARLAKDLAAAGPSLLVYVSCDPGTFARDAARLAERYRLVHLRGFDLFPQTHHLELVGTFTLRQ